jgi:ubiquinone/menaquinone biosynthesis C-methylase UbiE
MCRAIPGRVWAWLYDVAMRRVERGGLAELRRRIVGRAQGCTLEIGAGTGANLAFYPPAASPLTLTDPDPHKLSRLRGRAAPTAHVVRAHAHALPFADGAFDTVVTTLVLCSVPDQTEALAEVRRVLRPGGALLFLEHVRSAEAHLADRQDRWRPVWRAVAGGCEPNRDTVTAIADAGFAVDELWHARLPAAPAIVRPLAVGVATRLE